MSEPHVLIVGGGLGGLCLAQGLRGSGIGVSVFERDATARFRDQGYRIGLKATGARALHDCLPAHLFELCAATSIRPATRMVFMDQDLNPAKSFPIPSAPPGVSGMGVNRLTLREILLAGLDVQFGRTFERFEPTGDGRVRARFTDGTSATGDLLVGADGTNSAVRRQLLPGAVVDELHWAIYGRTPIRPGTLEHVPDVLVDTFNRATAPDGVAIAVATCRTREPVASAAARLAPGLHLTDLPDYFSWTLPLRDERLRDAAPAALHELAADLVRDFHPAVRRIVAEADVPATFGVCVTSARPVEPWAEPTVTLLGDAIHTMSPGRGDGANTALRDAGLLRDVLAEAGGALVPAKARYEAEMLRYGFQAVADSLHKPFAPSPGRGVGRGAGPAAPAPTS